MRLKGFCKLLFCQGAYLFLGFFCFFYSQSQELKQRTDSIENVYLNKSFLQSSELELLRMLSRDIQDPQKKLAYSNELITKAKEQDSLNYLFDAFLQLGNAYRLKSDLSLALETFLKAEKIAQDSINRKDLATVNLALGDVYSIMGNHENSVRYYESGIQQYRELKVDSVSLASALLNAGDEYFNAGKYEKAMDLFYESGLIFRKQNYIIGTAYNLGNIGMVYAKQGKNSLAEANINEAITILEKEKDFYPISVYLNYIADIYLNQNNPNQALKYSLRSLNLAKNYQLKDQISEANYELYKIYNSQDNHRLALKHYKDYIQYRDSLQNLENIEKMANLRTDLEVSKKQVEIDLANEQKESQRYISLAIAIVLILVSLLTFGLYRRNRYISKTRKILAEERERSDHLLLNILPEETAEELKVNGVVKAKKYQAVTVLFTDFKGFTKYAEELPPEELVKTVDMYFSAFDDIFDKYNVEKIKTIGDAYMCASGLPEPDEDHAKNMINAAKEILSFIKEKKKVHNIDEARFDIRIGIHTGPIVAGVVGKKKFAYDIWGDTVNIASRLEKHCEAGKINISETTYQLVKSDFEFEDRGEVAIKNRAPVSMYYVKL